MTLEAAQTAIENYLNEDVEYANLGWDASRMSPPAQPWRCYVRIQRGIGSTLDSALELAVVPRIFDLPVIIRRTATGDRMITGIDPIRIVTFYGGAPPTISNTTKPPPIFLLARVAATTNITISGPGAAIDGLTLAAGDRILLTAQATAKENGLWIFNGAAVALTRPTDFGGGRNDQCVYGMIVMIWNNASTNSGTHWGQFTTGTITIDTDANHWSNLTHKVAAGGTGLSTITAHALMVGNGVASVLTLLPSTARNVAISDGTDWTSRALVFADLPVRNLASITYDKSGDYTRTAATFADADGTNLKIAMTVNTGRAKVRASFWLGADNTASSGAEATLACDGTIGGDATHGLVRVEQNGRAYVTIEWTFGLGTPLSVASHNFTIQIRNVQSGATTTLYANGGATGTTPGAVVSMSAEEI